MRRAVSTLAFWTTLFLWPIVLCVWILIPTHSSATEPKSPPRADRLPIVTSEAPSYVSTFQEQLALSPTMFEGAMIEDKAAEGMDHPQMKGGVLLDGPSVRTLMFRNGQNEMWRHW